VISDGRRSAPLLAGATAGAVLIGTLVLVAPAGALPAEVHAALGSPVVAAGPAAAPTGTRPPRPPRPRTYVPAPQPAVAPATTPAPTIAGAPTTTPGPTPPPEPAPPAEPRRSGGPTAQVVELTNAERADAGCDPLDADPRLAAAAQGHAGDMSRNGYFDHVSRDGRRFDDRISAQGYPSPGGENIAQGQTSAAEVVEGWMNSPGHRRNILDCDFTAIGVGFDDDGDYWVQNFGF
jgi:uncharacterized protein YkwD